MTGAPTHLEAPAVLGLDTDDLTLGLQGLDGQRHARNQTCTHAEGTGVTKLEADSRALFLRDVVRDRACIYIHIDGE